MSPTLDGALSQIFGGNINTQTAQQLPTLKPKVAGEKLTKVKSMPSTEAPSEASSSAEFQGLAQQANQHYQQAMEHLRQGDWAGYGKEIKALGKVLNQLEAQSK